ncbi:MAG: efflux RND transporter periplasmic adaptor subunit [Ignavibacteriaceae bacterium]|jgi:cobalt-zinc-cadmium efflux system membrane fusion protein|nr:efflux RND transporter periplasmic adaptor subunit [Ignavibacteriaceae bacterium]
MKASMKLLITTSVLAFVLLGCGGKEETKKEESPKRQSEVVKLSAVSIKQIKLETEMVTFQPFTGYLSIPAKVITNQDNEAQIGSLVQGRVHQVFVKVGDYVKAGQVLMTVEGLDIGEIKAGFLIAKAALDYTKANYERQKKLYDEKIGSQKSLLESQAEYEKALAEFKAEDKKIHSVGLSDEDVTDGKMSDEHTSGTLPIKSSINGVVVERNVVIGQLVDATTNAFKVINTNTVWVDGQIYEKDIDKINQKTTTLFASTTHPDEKFTGRIIYIGQTVDEHSRTITVRGEFGNANNKLKPQMFGELKIPVGINAKAIMIPEESVVKETGQEYVFVQTSDSTTPSGVQAFEKRIVITGISVDNRIEIKEGLREGEKVASRSVFYLKSELKKEELEGDEL